MLNEKYQLQFRLRSDAIFGSAERSETGVDMDVQHDRWGCPYLPGRTLKGVLRENCADILDNLEQIGEQDEWRDAAKHLFGQPGAGLVDTTILHFDDAHLPQAIQQKLIQAVSQGKVSEHEVLEALTDIRIQTATDGWRGVAREKSLRTMRIILRKTLFSAPLFLIGNFGDCEKAMLAASLKVFRRCGTSRNRGLGEIEEVKLLDSEGNERLDEYFDLFRTKIGGVK